MGYEIDLLSLGNADSCMIRFFTPQNTEYVVLIDAGNSSDGERIVSHIKAYTNQKYIDLAICTHPDNDHIGGFFHLVENIEIKKFWIHDPGMHISITDIKKALSTATISRNISYITESIDNSTNLLSLIDKKGIPREEPFAGIGHSTVPLLVLGPTISFYQDLVKGFRDITSIIKEEILCESYAIRDISESESLSDTLDADDDKSFENNSSVIIVFKPDDKLFLFTGDAGVIAFDSVFDSYPGLKNVFFLKVPHHGSKYNLSSKIITQLAPKTAYIPASGTRKYPSRAVVNALKKIGCNVYSTHNNGTYLNYCEGITRRIGVIDATPL